MKNYLIVFVILSFFVNKMDAQSLYPEINSNQIKCIKINYTKIRKDDVQNKLLFYPEIATSTNTNLIQAIVYSIDHKGLTAYQAKANDESEEFKTVLTNDKIHQELGDFDKKIITNTGDTITKHIAYNPKDFTTFILKEAWVYDSIGSLIDKRIIGICPIRENTYNDDGQMLYKKIFWIYFPEYYASCKNISGNNVIEINNFLLKQKYVGLSFGDFNFWTNTSNSTTKQDSLDYIENTNYFNSLYQNKNIQAHIPNVSIETNIPNTADYKKPNNQIVTAKVNYYRVWNDSANNEIFLPKFPSFGYINLIDFILNSIHTSGLTAYKASAADEGTEFVEILTEDEVHSRMGDKIEDMIVELNTGVLDTITVHTPYNSAEVTSYLIKEIDLYNSAGDIIQTRVIGICPIRQYYREDDFDQEYPLFAKTFWIYFPEFQQMAAKQNVIKLSCDSSISFNDYILNRKYTGLNYCDSASWKNYYPDFDKNYFDKYYNHNFLNLYSDDLDKNNLRNNVDVVSAPQNTYYQKPPKYKSAKIIYTTFSIKTDTALFIPETPNFGYKSLIDILLNAILQKGYKCYQGDDLTKLLDANKVQKAMGQYSQEITLDNGDVVYAEIPYNSAYVQNYKLKELWLYDKENNVVDKRILAICPVRKYYTDSDYDQVRPLYQNTFWIDFKEFQTILSDNYVTEYKFTTPTTYNNYLVNHKFRGMKYNETEISKKDAKKLLKMLLSDK